VSNSRAGRGRLQHPVCTIGRRVRLVCAKDAVDFEAASTSAAFRRLDFNAGGEGYVAFQFAGDLEVGQTLPADWKRHGLVEFIVALGLDARARSALIAATVQLLATTFALRRDPVFRDQIAAVAELDGLPSGGVRAHRIDGAPTAICEAPPRLRLAADALLVCLSEQLPTGTVQVVVDYLDPRKDEKLAVVDFGTALQSGRALAILAEGLAVVELDVVTSENAEAFVRRLGEHSPDIINLAEIFDEERGADITVAAAKLPRTTAMRVEGFGFHLVLTDVVVLDHGLLISGRISDPQAILGTFTVIDHGLESHQPLAEAVLADIDVETELGSSARQFTCFIARKKDIKAPGNLAFRVTLEGGQDRFLYVPSCRAGLQQSRRDILSCLSRSGLSPAEVPQIFAPAMEPVHSALVARQSVRQTIDFGARSSRSRSIVIPLFRETGFLRSQLMAFSGDADLKASCQIVYVIDDPTIAAPVGRYLRRAAVVFDVDIRLVTLEHNGGYAQACNIGTQAADAAFLVLMNSDVIPLAPGWLDSLESAHASLPRYSAVGPKLLYADDSLQHAGMFFERGSDGAWQNNHYFKGFGASFADANVERDVPALTGALLGLSRADFLELGGLDTNFVIGDFEDSDLCLRLAKRGGRCRYVPTVALRHFERQSIGAEKAGWRTGATLYNQALHEARWAATINATSGEAGEPGRDAA